MPLCNVIVCFIYLTVIVFDSSSVCVVIIVNSSRFQIICLVNIRNSQKGLRRVFGLVLMYTFSVLGLYMDLLKWQVLVVLLGQLYLSKYIEYISDTFQLRNLSNLEYKIICLYCFVCNAQPWMPILIISTIDTYCEQDNNWQLNNIVYHYDWKCTYVDL